MSFTPFGLVFAPLVLALLAFRRTWLLPVLAVAAVLHAPAVALLPAVGGGRALGITPWLLVSAAVCVHLVGIVASRRRVETGATRQVRWLFAGWTVFCGWAIFSAFTTPFLFAGLPTYNHEVLDSIAHGTEPLAWRPMYALHAVNVAIVWMHFVYLLQIAPDATATRRLGVGLAWAAGLALAATLIQRWFVMAWPAALDAANLSLNPTYSQVLTSFGFGEFFRTNWPFSEPSYASVWFASVYSAGLGLAFFAPRPWLGVASAAAGALGLANTLGGSGIASAVLASLLVCGAALLRWRHVQGDERRRLGRRLLAPALLAVLLPLALWGLQQTPHPDVKEGTLSTDLVGPRLADAARAGNTRSESNRVALRLIGDTYGFGVGLGANRASSYALNLASTIGIPGSLLFFLLVAQQARLLQRAGPETPLRMFVEYGCVGMLAGVIAGIPDVAWPALWIWLLAAFLLVSSAHAHTPSTSVGHAPSS